MLILNVVIGVLIAMSVHAQPHNDVKGEVVDQMNPKQETATFAGGCFWCMQPPYDNLKGVVSVTVGYTGGSKANPTYEEVCTGTTGHAESIQIVFDPAQISYQKLLDIFWQNVDPTVVNAQFADHGTQYRTAVFYHSEEQRRLAEESKKYLGLSGRFRGPIVTEIVPTSTFYTAEGYHQCYYQKNPTHYKRYKSGSGREGFLKKTWGKKE